MMDATLKDLPNKHSSEKILITKDAIVALSKSMTLVLSRDAATSSVSQHKKRNYKLPKKHKRLSRHVGGRDRKRKSVSAQEMSTGVLPHVSRTSENVYGPIRSRASRRKKSNAALCTELVQMKQLNRSFTSTIAGNEQLIASQ